MAQGSGSLFALGKVLRCDVPTAASAESGRGGHRTGILRYLGSHSSHMASSNDLEVWKGGLGKYEPKDLLSH